MGKYDHRQHVLSDWLAELEQRFQLGEDNTDKAKITWCQLLIGATGSSIVAGLEDDATWEAAKETLLSRLGAGSVRDEAWASLKQLKRGSKEIMELAGEAEKLAKHLHPRHDEAAERQAADAFLGALDRPLAAEVQKLGCRYQPIPRGKPHICSCYSSRAYQQAGPTMEGPIRGQESPQPLSGGVRRWFGLANHPH